MSLVVDVLLCNQVPHELESTPGESSQEEKALMVKSEPIPFFWVTKNDAGLRQADVSGTVPHALHSTVVPTAAVPARKPQEPGLVTSLLMHIFPGPHRARSSTGCASFAHYHRAQPAPRQTAVGGLAAMVLEFRLTVGPQMSRMARLASHARTWPWTQLLRVFPGPSPVRL